MVSTIIITFKPDPQYRVVITTMMCIIIRHSRHELQIEPAKAVDALGSLGFDFDDVIVIKMASKSDNTVMKTDFYQVA